MGNYWSAKHNPHANRIPVFWITFWKSQYHVKNNIYTHFLLCLFESVFEMCACVRWLCAAENQRKLKSNDTLLYNTRIYIHIADGYFHQFISDKFVCGRKRETEKDRNASDAPIYVTLRCLLCLI